MNPFRRSQMLVVTVIIAGLIAASAPVSAADVCYNAEIEEDPFSGETTMLLRSWMGMLSLGDEGPMLEFFVGAAGAVGSTLPPGFEMLVLLQDGTRVTLVSDRPAGPTGRAYVTEYSASVSTRWSLHFPLTALAMHAMVQSPIKALRYTLQDEITIDVTPERIKDFRNDLACLTNHMGPTQAAD